MHLRRGAWALAWVLALAVTGALRWSWHDGLYGVRWDGAVLIDWAQTTVRPPHGAASALLRLPAQWPLKTWNLAGSLALAGWSCVVGGGIATAQVWSNLVALVAAGLLAILAARSPPPDGERVDQVTALSLFILVALNPGLLRESVAPSWHGWTVFLLAVALALAGETWRSSAWRRERRAALWIVFALTLYSVYLLPVVLVVLWALVDLVASEPGRPRRRALAFWLALALAALPGAVFVAMHPSEAERWARVWFTPDWRRAPQVLLSLILGSGLLLAALATLRRTELCRRLPIYLFSFGLLGLFVFVMNREATKGVLVEKLGVYLLPGAALAAGAAARRLWAARGALAAAALALVLMHATWPEAVQRLAPGRPGVPWEVDYARQAAAVLAARPDAQETPLIFANYGHAALVLLRLPGPRPATLYPAQRYFDSVRRGRELAFLATCVPPLATPPHRLLLVAPEHLIDEMLRRVPAPWRVEHPGRHGARRSQRTVVPLVRQ